MTKRKDGLWQETVMINGKRRFFYGRTKADVLKKINAFRGQQAAGKTFDEVADEWWAVHEKTLEKNTVKSYAAPLSRAKDAFKGMPVTAITPPMVQDYVRSFEDQNFAKKTITNNLLVLNMILSFAVVRGYAAVNPAREISVSRKLKNRRREIASDQDIKTVKASFSLPFGDIAFWALYTGCRKGELLALTWEDVKDGYITVSKSVYFEGGHPKLKQPKTEAGVRQVPVLKALEEKIRPGKGPIFPGPEGGMLTECQFRKRWDRYVKQTGISCTLHQLRHAYATMLYEHGIDVLDAQQLLGHANAATTQDVYTHIRDSRREQVRKKLYDADI